MVQFLSEYTLDNFDFPNGNTDVLENDTEGLTKADSMGEDYQGSDQGLTSMVDDDDDIEDDDDDLDDEELDVDEVEVTEEETVTEVVPSDDDIDEDLDVDEDDDDDEDDDV